MTPQDHNKVLGIMHLIYGGFFLLMTLLMVFIFAVLGVGLSAALANDPNAPPAGVFVALMGFLVVVYGLLSVPSLVAGYGMLKRRPWGRLAGIIAAFLSAVSFPFGTALCVYTLWFHFGDAGKEFERSLPDSAARGTLGGAPASAYGWGAQQPAGRRADEYAPRADEYAPPPQPPSWRE